MGWFMLLASVSAQFVRGVVSCCAVPDLPDLLDLLGWAGALCRMGDYLWTICGLFAELLAELLAEILVDY